MNRTGTAALPSWPDPSELLGIKASILTAGLAGGVLSAMMGDGSFLKRIVTGSVGCAASIWVTPVTTAALAMARVAPSDEVQHASAFMTGLLFMSAASAAIRWLGRFGESGPLSLGQWFGRGGTPPER